MKHTSFLHLILFYLLLEKNYGRYMQQPPIFNYPLLRNMLRNWLLLSKAKKRDSESHKKNETHVRFIHSFAKYLPIKLNLCNVRDIIIDKSQLRLEHVIVIQALLSHFSIARVMQPFQYIIFIATFTPFEFFSSYFHAYLYIHLIRKFNNQVPRTS